MSFGATTSGAAGTFREASERFECAGCGYRATLSVCAYVEVVKHGSTHRPHELASLRSDGSLSDGERQRLAQLETAEARVRQHGSVEAGLQAAAAGASARGAAGRLGWLADTARCPRCGAPRAARYAARVREAAVQCAGIALLVGAVGGVASDVLGVSARLAVNAGVGVAIALLAAAVLGARARQQLHEPYDGERTFHELPGPA